MVELKGRVEAVAKYNPGWNSRGVKIDHEWWNMKGTEADLERTFNAFEIGKPVEVFVNPGTHELLSVAEPESKPMPITREAKLDAFKESQPRLSTDDRLDIIAELLRHLIALQEEEMKAIAR